nr:MAG TPA: hypothetical protein [Bacteriophage sp.]
MYSSANRLCLSFSFVIFHHLQTKIKEQDTHAPYP